VDAASIHDAFPVEQFEVRGYENSVFFHRFVADLFTVLGLDLNAINSGFLKDFTKFLEVSVDDKAMCLPH